MNSNKCEAEENTFQQQDSFNIATTSVISGDLSAYAERIRQLELDGNLLRNKVQSFLTEGGDTDIDISNRTALKTYTTHSFNPFDITGPSSSSFTVDEPKITDSSNYLDHLDHPSTSICDALLNNDSFLPYVDKNQNNEFSKKSSVHFDFLPATTNSLSTTTKEFKEQNRLSLPFEDVCPLYGSSKMHENSIDLNDSKGPNLRLPPSLLERELKEAREHADFLRLELRQTHESHEKERFKLRECVEQLKSQIYTMQCASEETIRKQENLLQEKERIISQMKDGVQKLIQSNQEMEKALKEAQQHLEINQRNNHNKDDALDMLRHILSAVEVRRGMPFFKGNDLPLAGQSECNLIHTVDRCIRELEDDLERRSYKIKHLEQELETVKRGTEREKEDLVMELNKRCNKNTSNSKMSMDRDKYCMDIQYANNRYDHLSQQEARAQKELEEIRDHLSNERKSRLESLTKLESQLSSTNNEKQKLEEDWRAQRHALEVSLDQSHRDIARFSAEREHALSLVENIRLQLTKAEKQLQESEKNKCLLITERDCLGKQVNELTKKNNEQEKSLQRKKKNLLAFDEAICALIKGKWSAECWWQKYGVRDDNKNTVKHIFNVLTELATLICQRDADLLNAQKHLKERDEKVEHVKNELNLLRVEVEGIRQQKEHLDKLICNRSAEVERLTAERDYYFRMLDERTEELSTYKVERHRLTAQLSEKIKDFEKYAQKLENNHNKVRQKLHGEVEHLEQLKLNLTSVKKERDELFQLVKKRENDLKESLAEKGKLALNLQQKNEQLENTLKSRLDLSKQLVELQTEIQRLGSQIQENSLLHPNIRGGKQDSVRKNLVDLSEQIRALIKTEKSLASTKEDLIFCSESMTVRDSGNNAADGSKNKMAAESYLASVKGRVFELEKKVDTLNEERIRLREENQRLCSLLERSNRQKTDSLHGKTVQMDEMQQQQQPKDRTKHDKENLRTKAKVNRGDDSSGEILSKQKHSQQGTKEQHPVQHNSSLEKTKLSPNLASILQGIRSVLDPLAVQDVNYHSKHRQQQPMKLSEPTDVGRNNNNVADLIPTVSSLSRSTSQPHIHQLDHQLCQFPPVPYSREDGDLPADGEESIYSGGSLTEVDRHLSESSLGRRSGSPLRGSPLHRAGQQQVRWSQDLINEMIFSGRSSPVESLLMSSANQRRPQNNFVAASTSTPKKQKSNSKDAVVVVVDNDAGEMCARLEEQLQDLEMLNETIKHENPPNWNLIVSPS